MLARTLRFTAITTVLSLLTFLTSAESVKLERLFQPSPSLIEAVSAQYRNASRVVDASAEFTLPGGAACTVTPMTCNTVRSGTLEQGDCTANSDATYLDVWTFHGNIGQTVTITMRSTSFDSYLYLGDPSGNMVAADDQSGGELDAKITFTLTESGEWGIVANQVYPASGSYQLTLECSAGDACTPQLRGTACGANLTGTIDVNDCIGEGLPFEFWTFTGVAGQNVAIAASRTAGAGNIGLGLFHADGTTLASDNADDITSSISSTLSKSGTWVIAVLGTSFMEYRLNLNCQTQSTCFRSADSLCLNNNRFRVTLAATDPRTGNTGIGHSVPYNDINGFFAIPDLTNDPTNFEVFVKVLDGRTTNGHFWVFYGGMTDFAYTITVVETATGATKTYVKPGLEFVGGADTSAF
ncbi:MAG: PPC domain-containing protein [Thermoanaerobaculia bacterium]